MNIFKKAISLILACTMMMYYCMIASTAIDESEVKASFSFTKVSETPDEVVFSVNLEKGSFNCFDITVFADEGCYECTKIVRSAEIKAWDTDDNTVSATYPATGKASFADNTTFSCEKTTSLFLYTFKKLCVVGAIARDYTPVIDSCYTKTDGKTEDISAKTEFVNKLPTKHTHPSDGEFVEEKPSTCTVAGTEVRYCIECGKVAQRRNLPLAAHTEAHRTVNPTCETNGAYITYCTVCLKDLKSEPIEKTGHTPKDLHKDPTCEDDGYDKTICETCTETLYYKLLPKKGHLNKDVSHKDPSCEEAGYNKVVCLDCKKVLEDEVLNPTGHLNTHEDKLDPTCGEDGYIKIICDDCKKTISTQVLPATNEHKETVPEHKDATCTEDGYDRLVCKECHKTISETILPATNHAHTHNEHLDPKCEVPGYDKTVCDDCTKTINTVEIPPTGHLHKNMKITDPKCEEDGCIETYCTDCKKLLETEPIKATGHKLDELYKPATCTEDGYIGFECRVCHKKVSYSSITKTGHNWTDWKTVQQATYMDDGIQERECRYCHITETKSIPKIVVKPTSIVILPENNITLKVGTSTQIYANLLPQEASYSNTIIWTSSNEKVLTVDENGLVKAVRFGSATITASTADGKVKASKKIKVKFSLWQIIVNLILGWITGKK